MKISSINFANDGELQWCLSKELIKRTKILYTYLNELIYLCKTKPDKNKFIKFMF